MKGKSMATICILMSTYNGEKYIREQMESLLMQKGVDLRIVIRDDGSSDSTCRIIEDEYPMAELRKGSNIGCEASFMELLYSAPIADYYAFCDQDDVWMEDKLITAVKALEMKECPALYGCNLLACDENLNPIKNIHSNRAMDDIQRRFKRDIICNMHGCVLVWNRYLQVQLQKYTAKNLSAHDVWVNSVANAIGSWNADSTPHIKYRLHGDNTSGYATSIIDRITKGVKLYLFRNHLTKDMTAKDILEGYGNQMDHNSEGYYQLTCLSEYKKGIKNKIRLIRCKMIKEKAFMDRALWILCIILNKY